MSSEIKLELVGTKETFEGEIVNIGLNVSIPNTLLTETTTRDLRFGIKNKEKKVKVKIIDSQVLPSDLVSELFFKIVIKDPGDYVAEALYKGHHVINSPLTFTVKSSSQIKNIEQYAHEVLDEWKRLNFNDHEDKEQFGDSLINDEDYSIKTKILQKDNRPSIASNAAQDLTKFSNWGKSNGLVVSFGKEGVQTPIGFCILQAKQMFVIASTKEDRVKMYNLKDGKYIKELKYNSPDGPFIRPSDMASLKTGKFAVRDERRIMIFDDDGNYVETVWKSKGGMRCFGLAVDGEDRLACLMETSSHSLLNLQLYDLNTGKWKVKVEMVSILGKDMSYSKCRFLTYHQGNFYITDNGLNKVYIVQEDELGYSVGEFLNSSYHQFNNPGGVALDDVGNIVVVDSKNHQLCLFTPDKNLSRIIPVNLFL